MNLKVFADNLSGRTARNLQQQVRALAEVNLATQTMLDRAVEDIGWYKASQDDAKSGTDRASLRKACRTAYQLTDPLVKGAIRLMTYFAFGAGMDCPSSKDQSVQDALQQAWDLPENRQAMFGRRAQFRRSTQLLLDGDLFPILGMQGTDLSIRLLPASYVKECVTDPDDGTRVLYWVAEVPRVNWDGRALNYVGDGQADRVLYKDIGNTDPANDPVGAKLTGPEPQWVQHIAINQIDDASFGWPEPAASLSWFANHKKLAANQATISAATAALMNLLIVDTEVDASAVKTNLERMGQDPNTFAPGGVNVMGKGLDLKSERASTGATDAWQDSRLFRMVALAGMNLSLHYLGDPENANLATATSMELPVLKALQGYQAIWADAYREMLDWYLLMRQLSGEYDIHTPNILAQDLAVIAQAVTSGHDRGLLTQRQASGPLLEGLGFDDIDEELDALEQDAAETAPVAPGTADAATLASLAATTGGRF